MISRSSNGRIVRPNAIPSTSQIFAGDFKYHDKPSSRAACHDRVDSDATRSFRIICAIRSARRRTGTDEGGAWPRRQAESAAKGRAARREATTCRTSSTASHTGAPDPAAAPGSRARTPDPSASPGCCARASDPAASFCCPACASDRATSSAYDRGTARTHATADPSGGHNGACRTRNSDRADAAAWRGSEGRAARRRQAGSGDAGCNAFAAGGAFTDPTRAFSNHDTAGGRRPNASATARCRAFTAGPACAFSNHAAYGRKPNAATTARRSGFRNAGHAAGCWYGDPARRRWRDAVGATWCIANTSDCRNSACAAGGRSGPVHASRRRRGADCCPWLGGRNATARQGPIRHADGCDGLPDRADGDSATAAIAAA
jgi:hypothetical protein